jgi:beta-glucanase (GH16 family)
MPASDLSGWRLIFSDDFTTNVSVGSFPGTEYAQKWTAYPSGWSDTSGNGQYSPEKTLSVSNGVLVIDVHTEDGTHYVSAPEPMLGTGQLYGRYSIRFRATQTTSDYKTAWLLWPDSERWPDDGEIDFPEGNLDSTFNAFMHYASASGGQDAFQSSATFAEWHTATTEWVPGKVTFYVDAEVLGTSTTQVPSTPMHYVLQTETNLDGVVPSATTVGRLEIDWVVIWARN